jgi:hypothetical protein
MESSYDQVEYREKRQRIHWGNKFQEVVSQRIENQWHQLLLSRANFESLVESLSRIEWQHNGVPMFGKEEMERKLRLMMKEEQLLRIAQSQPNQQLVQQTFGFDSHTPGLSTGPSLCFVLIPL